MKSRSFRNAVLAAALAFPARRRTHVTVIRRFGQRLAHRVMGWMDARREQINDQS